MRPHPALVARQRADFQPVWSTPDMTAWNEKPWGERWAMLGLALFFAASAILMMVGSEEPILPFAVVFAAAALLLFINGVTQACATVPDPPPGWFTLVLALCYAELLVGGYAIVAAMSDAYVAALLTGPVAVVLIALIGWLIWARLRTWRAARRMSAAMSGDAAAQAGGSGSAPERAPPPWRLEVYRAMDLPLPQTVHPVLTAQHTVAGQPPRTLLYLYNFFSEEFLQGEALLPWRRHGPVYMLGSPMIAGFTRLARQGMPLLPTPQAFDLALAATAGAAPIPPGDPSLPWAMRHSGAYPVHLFFCADSAWKHGALRLLDSAERVLLDATGFKPGRAGLRWEIDALAARRRLEDVLVLVDDSTDQTALFQAFEEAMRRMPLDSPNRRPREADGEVVIRWVTCHEQRPDRGRQPIATPVLTIPGRPARAATAAELLDDFERYDRMHALFELGDSSAHAQPG